MSSLASDALASGALAASPPPAAGEGGGLASGRGTPPGAREPPELQAHAKTTEARTTMFRIQLCKEGCSPPIRELLGPDPARSGHSDNQSREFGRELGRLRR